MHYDGDNKRLIPDLARTSGNARSTWYFAILSKVLGEDISENRLMRHALKK